MELGIFILGGFSLFVFYKDHQRHLGSRGVGSKGERRCWNTQFSRQLHDYELEGVEAFFRQVKL